MAQRKNATFALDKTYGSKPYRGLIHSFYDVLDVFFPGSTPIPIPPGSQVHPQHDAKKQALIVADYAVRKIAPITLRAVGLTKVASELEQENPITNKMSANSTAERVKLRAVHGGDAVADATVSAAEAAFSAAYDNYNAVGSTAARAVANAAALNPDATWAAVNDMLQAL